MWQKTGGGVAGGAEFSVPGSLAALRKPWQVEMGKDVGVSQVPALVQPGIPGSLTKTMGGGWDGGEVVLNDSRRLISTSTVTSESPPTPGPTKDSGLIDSLLWSPRTHNPTSSKSSWQVDALVAKEVSQPSPVTS